MNDEDGLKRTVIELSYERDILIKKLMTML